MRVIESYCSKCHSEGANGSIPTFGNSAPARLGISLLDQLTLKLVHGGEERIYAWDFAKVGDGFGERAFTQTFRGPFCKLEKNESKSLYPKLD